MDHARELAAEFVRARHPTAVLSVQPLTEALHTECVTFRIGEKSHDEATTRERMVRGYLCQFYQTYVHHVASVHEVARQTQRTAVLLLHAHQSAVSSSEWATIQTLKEIRKIKPLLERLGMKYPVNDVFKLQLTPTHFSVLLRIPEKDVLRWVASPKMPVAVSPIGEHNQSFR
eukprot:1891917-Amphidinium_carterae.1